MVANISLPLAREGIYRFLASALTDPRHPSRIDFFNPESLYYLQAAAELLRLESAAFTDQLGFGEIGPERLNFRTLWTLFHDLSFEEWRTEYERVFGLMSCRECPPFETEFQPNNEPFFRTQQLADIAGFYHAFGVQAPANASERPDHLTLELEFMALLLMKERLASADDLGRSRGWLCAEAAKSFFEAHLAWWVPSFAKGLRFKAGEGYYAELAQVLASFVTFERRWFGMEAPQAPMQPTPDLEADAGLDCAGCAEQRRA